MKKILLTSLFAATALLTSCSDDETTPVTTNTALELRKTITYIPSKAAYDNNEADSYRQVQYFESNKVIADSTFDTADNLSGKVIHTYTANVYKFSEYGSSSSSGLVLFRELTRTYDNLGRLTEEKGTGASTLTKFVYGPGTITIQHYDSSTGLIMPQYTATATLNSLGLIEDGCEYIGDKIVRNNLNPFPVTLDYYSVVMPANLQKTIHQRNNLFLESGESRVTTVENGNYYLKNYGYEDPTGLPETVTFTSTFDAAGYITHTKGNGYVAPYQAGRYLERFYYYE